MMGKEWYNGFMNFGAPSIESHAHEMENTSFASSLLPLEAKFSIIRNKLFNGHYNRGKGVLCTYIMKKLVFGWQIFTSNFFAESYRL